MSEVELARAALNKQAIHLQFIYDRLVNVHGENPDVDYMIVLRSIIEDIEAIHLIERNLGKDWVKQLAKSFSEPEYTPHSPHGPAQ